MIYKKVQEIKEPISATGVGCWNFGGDWDFFEEQNSIRLDVILTPFREM